MNNQIHLIKRLDTFGEVEYFAYCNDSRTFTKLLMAPTLVQRDLELIEQLGYQIRVTDETRYGPRSVDNEWMDESTGSEEDSDED